jgi:hypothetical protein
VIDRRYLPVALFGFALAAAVLQPIRSYDLWWQLATGKWILEMGSVPREDPFSFTRPGAPWVDHEWLFQVGAYLLHSAGGWRALLGMDLLLTAGVFGILGIRMRRERVGAGWTLLVLLLSLAGARFRLDPRPELAGLLLTAALLALLQASREEGRGRLAALAPLLFAVWANLHPSVLLGAAVTGLWLAAELAGARVRGAPLPGGGLRFGLLVASPLFLLANPYGHRLLAVPFHLRSIVSSGHAPNLEWAAPGFRDFPLLYLAFGLAVAVAAAGWRRLDPAPACAAVLCAVLAFLHLRNIGFFFVALPIALAGPIASLAGQVRIPERAVAMTAAAASLLVGILFVGSNRVEGRDGYLARVAPEKAVRFLEENRIGERLFNDVKFGGYLIWRRFPARRVFIDGRNEVYDPLLREIFAALGTWEEWEAFLSRHRIDAALLRRHQMQPVRYPPETPGAPGRTDLRPFSSAYFQASRWALVYWDDAALVYVRRDDPAGAALRDVEYRWVHPDDAVHLMGRLARGEVTREAVLAEIDRRLAEDPACRTARRLRELFQGIPAEPPGR